MSNFLGGFASSSVLPVIDGVHASVGDMAYTIDSGGFWNAIQPVSPPGAQPAWAFVDVLRGSPGPQGQPGVGEPGPQGQIGPPGMAGARGPMGPAGKSSFSYLSQAFQVPAVSAPPVNVSVTDTSWINAGQLVYIPGAGTFIAIGTPSTYIVPLANSGDPNNMPVGTQVQAGTLVSPANMRGPMGPAGNVGPQGPPGPQGVSGTSAYSTLSLALTVPAAGSSVTAFVVSAASFGVGQIVYISGGDYFSVTAVNTTNNSLTLTNLAYPGGAAPGVILPVGATVSGTGPQGPQGAVGPVGPQGPQGLIGVAPTGVVTMFAGTTPPGGWVWCNGALLDRVQYSTLFSVIGTIYNVGTPDETSSNFRLPNFQSRFPIGASADGTTYPLRAPLSTETWGEAAHLLVLAELAQHNHPATDTGHQHLVPAHTHGWNDNNHANYIQGHSHPWNDNAHAHFVNAGSIKYTFPSTGGDPFVMNWSYDNSVTTQGPNQAVGSVGVSGAFWSGGVNEAVGSVATAGAFWDNLGYAVLNIGTVGSNSPHNNLPPYQTTNFIIKT